MNDVLSPFFTAFIIAYLLEPITRKAASYGITRTIASMISILLGTVILSGIVSLVIPIIDNEVDNLKQLKEIMGLKFNTVLFDNMSVKNRKAGIRLAKKYYETEASGNIKLKTVKSVAATGVDRISVGSITHSASAIDLKLEI